MIYVSWSLITGLRVIYAAVQVVELFQILSCQAFFNVIGLLWHTHVFNWNSRTASFAYFCWVLFLFRLLCWHPLSLIELIISLKTVETAAKESTETCHCWFLASMQLPQLYLLSWLDFTYRLLSYIRTCITFLIVLLNQSNFILFFVFLIKSLELKITTFRILLVTAATETLLLIQFRQACNHSIEQFQLTSETLLGIIMIH